MKAGVLLVLALLVNSDFHDPVSCYVQGYVWRLAEAEAVAFTRVDTCPGVRHRADGPLLILESPTHWVAIIVPPEYGQRQFWYRWGSRAAHVGLDSIGVEWGSVNRG